VEQIKVRLDDKLSRLIHGSAAGEDVVLDLLGYLILLRVATKEQWDKQVHVAVSTEAIDEVLKHGIPAEFLKAARQAPSIADVLSDQNGPAAKPLFPPGVGSYAALRDVLDREPPREDVGFALTDAESAEAERAVDAEWGGAIRRKLGIARGKLDGVAQDLEESGGWEETVKEIRQTLRETADPGPPARPVEEFLASENKQLLEENLDAAYEAAGISDLQNLAQHIKSMRAERDALKLQTRPPLRVDYVHGEGLKISCGEQLVVMPPDIIAATFGWEDVAERKALLKLATEVAGLLTYLQGRCRSDGSEDAKERATLDAYGYVRARMRTAMDALPQSLKEDVGGA
jgi:hypothetical protein